MRKILFSICAITLFIICMGFISTAPPPSGYGQTLIGTWDIIQPSGRFSDTTISSPLIPSSTIYQFREDDSVTITINDVDTTIVTMGWELQPINEDTIYFSHGPKFFIYNKTLTNFNARIALSQSGEYIDFRFRRKKDVIGNPIPIGR